MTIPPTEPKATGTATNPPSTDISDTSKVAIEEYVSKLIDRHHAREDRLWTWTSRIVGGVALLGLGLLGWALHVIAESAEGVARNTAITTTQSYLVSTGFIARQTDQLKKIEDSMNAATTDAAIARQRVVDLSVDAGRLQTLLSNTPNILAALRDVSSLASDIASNPGLQKIVLEQLRNDIDRRIIPLEDYVRMHNSVFITDNASLCPDRDWTSTSTPVWVSVVDLPKFQPGLVVDFKPEFYSGTRNGQWGVAYLRLCVRKK